MARVEDLAVADPGAPPDVGHRGSQRHDHEALHQHLQRLDERVTSLASATAAALHAVTGRLDELQGQLRLLEPRPDDTLASPSGGDGGTALALWRARLAGSLPAGERVLYAQADADEVVAELRAEGVDAYGITNTATPHRPGPDVRSGDLLTHLRAVPDGALGAVVLAGGPELTGPHAIGPLVFELSRVARQVVVISEAPWWWRRRLGAVDADLAPRRPLDPDTWMDAFDGHSMVGTAQYDPEGQTYQLVVRART